jgi:glutamine synthetase
MRFFAIEFRTPDGSCNPYLAFAACLIAGLDGIEHRLHPGGPIDKDLYDLPPEEVRDVQHLPGSLEEVLDALQRDHQLISQHGEDQTHTMGEVRVP